MSSALKLCFVEESGWKPGRLNPDLSFRTRGAALSVELRRWDRGETLNLCDPADLTEEMGAVLEGRFELACGDERYELGAGDGILVPPGEPHVWRVLSDGGVLYRVSCIGSAP